MLVAYRILHLIGFAIAHLVAPFQAKVRQSIQGRKGLLERMAKHRADWVSRPYWFHFASSGEFEQALPILDALKAKQPSVPVFLSYFSPSGKRAVELETARRKSAQTDVPWDASDFSPFDFQNSVRDYVGTLQPRALIILNREFWPEIFETCFSREIPVYVFASFLSRRAKRSLRLYKRWLERLTFLGTVDRSTADFLRRELNNQAIDVVGDPRVERVLMRRNLPAPATFALEPGSKLFVAASIWTEDLRALRPSLKLLLGLSNWRAFLVPHEPSENFLREIESELKKEGIYCVRWSKRRPGAPLPGVVIVDSVGWLAELYRHANLAFIGGSFRGRVHSVLEPAAYSLPIVTGPYIQNSFEACQMAGLSKGLIAAKTPEQLAKEIGHLAMDPNNALERGRRVFEFLKERQGAGQRYSQILSEGVEA